MTRPISDKEWEEIEDYVLLKYNPKLSDKELLTDYKKFVEEHEDSQLKWSWSFWSNWKEVLYPDEYNWLDFVFIQFRYERECYSCSEGRREFYFGFMGLNVRIYQEYIEQ